MHVIATAGHVDHGKSTLVRMLTGTEPDRWPEERRRGLTIDLGFAWTSTAAGTLAFVDVPGHGRFVPNMLAGIGPVPAALLVVAADEGWMPQSGEHLEALDALGVRHGVLAVTRCDLADPAPAIRQARRETQRTALAGMPAVEVSGATGAGLDQLRQALTALARGLPEADADASPRLWVDRAFTIRGAGTVVTGTLPAGTLRTGQRLVLHTSGRSVGVRGLQCLGASEDEVGAVARVAVNLRGVAHDQVRRGDALLVPDQWLSTEVLDVRLRGGEAGELPREMMLHVGSAATSCRVRPLGADTARLALRTRLPLRIGDRALLRDPGQHRIAGALVLDVRPPKLRRRGAAKQRARELDTMDGRPDGAAELARRRTARAADLAAMGARLPHSPDGEWLADAAYLDERGARLVELLQRNRQRHPLEDGMPAEAARRALQLPESALLNAVLRAPSAEGISLRSGRLRLSAADTGATTSTAAVSAERDGSELPEPVGKHVRQVCEQLRAAPFQAPTADELAERGLRDKELAAAERAGHLHRIGTGIVLLPSFEQQALERLAALDSPFTLSQARKALGTTRRVAVPLLELLARRGRTRRLADGTHRLVP